MAGLTTATLNFSVDNKAAIITHLSLHTSDPGSTGTAEATGGTPAYARKSVTWAASANGSKPSSNAQAWDVPAGTYTHVGAWSALTGGTFRGSAPLAAAATFGVQGTYTLPTGEVALTEINV